MFHKSGTIIYWFILATLVTACSSSPLQQQKQMPATGGEGEVRPLDRPALRAPSRPNGAVTVLLVDARAAISEGKYDRAVAHLERALRIEPRNAWVWHYLAEVRLQQQRYALAINLAARSNNLAHGQVELIERNRLIIEKAKRRQR